MLDPLGQGQRALNSATHMNANGLTNNSIVSKGTHRERHSFKPQEIPAAARTILLQLYLPGIPNADLKLRLGHV
jgi:hypothetical protein